MSGKSLPLQEVSIRELFYGADHAVYEVPIYQRNYAWGIDEIAALVQDVYDAYFAKKDVYFIGTLVTFHKGKRVYEVIDGQQRLTTIYLMLTSLDTLRKTSSLTVRAKSPLRPSRRSESLISTRSHVLTIALQMDTNVPATPSSWFRKRVETTSANISKTMCTSFSTRFQRTSISTITSR